MVTVRYRRCVTAELLDGVGVAVAVNDATSVSRLLAGRFASSVST